MEGRQGLEEAVRVVEVEREEAEQVDLLSWQCSVDTGRLDEEDDTVTAAGGEDEEEEVEEEDGENENDDEDGDGYDNVTLGQGWIGTRSG